jgi:hypothetical protein
MCIDFDAEPNYHSQQATVPVISIPVVNIMKLNAPNIIDHF